MTPVQILSELAAEGVRKMALVADEPDRYLGVAAAAGRFAPPSRRNGRGPARVPRVQGRFGHPLRPALRNRAPAPAQARQMARSGDPHVHPPGSVRGLRRLWKSLQLHGDRAARDRMGPQASHQPVELQQGLQLHRRILPELRHRPRRPLAQARLRRPARAPAGSRAGPAGDGRTVQRARRRHRRFGRRHGEPDARGRRLSRRAFQLQSRPDRPQPEIRGCHLACAHGAQAGRPACDADRRRRGRRADRLRPHRRGRRRKPVEAQSILPRGDFGRRDADRRIRPQSQLERRRASAGGAADVRARRWGVRARCAAPRQGAARRRDRLQHVHARRRMAEGARAAPARGDRTGDRAQRRRHRSEQAGVRMGPARGA